MSADLRKIFLDCLITDCDRFNNSAFLERVNPFLYNLRIGYLDDLKAYYEHRISAHYLSINQQHGINKLESKQLLLKLRLFLIETWETRLNLDIIFLNGDYENLMKDAADLKALVAAKHSNQDLDPPQSEATAKLIEIDSNLNEKRSRILPPITEEDLECVDHISNWVDERRQSRMSTDFLLNGTPLDWSHVNSTSPNLLQTDIDDAEELGLENTQLIDAAEEGSQSAVEKAFQDEKISEQRSELLLKIQELREKEEEIFQQQKVLSQELASRRIARKISNAGLNTSTQQSEPETRAALLINPLKEALYSPLNAGKDIQPPPFVPPPPPTNPILEPAANAPKSDVEPTNPPTDLIPPCPPPMLLVETTAFKGRVVAPPKNLSEPKSNRTQDFRDDLANQLQNFQFRPKTHVIRMERERPKTLHDEIMTRLKSIRRFHVEQDEEEVASDESESFA